MLREGDSRASRRSVVLPNALLLQNALAAFNLLLPLRDFSGQQTIAREAVPAVQFGGRQGAQDPYFAFFACLLASRTGCGKEGSHIEDESKHYLEQAKNRVIKRLTERRARHVLAGWNWNQLEPTCARGGL